ncbi:MAG: hypothetical protein H7Y36_10190 [Armatimonadetes bacterium]|nr:hypothetical protein [Akkermansiaceae bacterium]
MFDPTILYNTDQEIMAYLFNEMEYYHPEDLKRSRVRQHYQLRDDTCAALHFPGKMWLPHMAQIVASHDFPILTPRSIRYQPTAPLTHSELFRMRAQVKISNSSILGKPINLIRKIRGAISG